MKTLKITALLVLMVSCVGFGVVTVGDYSTITVTDEAPYLFFRTPAMSGYTGDYGSHSVRFVLEYDPSSPGWLFIHTEFELSPGNWMLDTNAEFFNLSEFPSDYLALSLMWIFANIQDFGSVPGDMVESSMYFSNGTAGLAEYFDVAPILADADSDGVKNYMDADYNPFMVSVPEPESVALILAGMVLIMNRLEFYSVVSAISAAVLTGFGVWFLFVGAKNEKRIW